MAALLEQMAALDPEDALTIATAAENLTTRRALLLGVLRGWARIAPADALGAFARFDENTRACVLPGLIAGLVSSGEHPRESLRLLADHAPALGADCGAAFLTDLARADRFPEALEALQAAPVARIGEWVGSLFDPWGQRDPEAALRAAAQLSESRDRASAWESAIKGWASASPESVAAYSTTLPSGTLRRTALLEASRSWVKSDPQRATDWLAQLPPEPSFDHGAVEIASLPAFAASRPEAALRWALSIENPDMREGAVTGVMRYWVPVNAKAARIAAATAPGLDIAARQRVLESIPPD